MKWIAVNNVGKFRQGRIYDSSQLGVIGRMAAYSGHLVPHVDPLPSARKRPVARKKPTQSERRKRGWADGEPGAAESVPGEVDVAEAGQD
jgi:hypothetical protein